MMVRECERERERMIVREYDRGRELERDIKLK
jgi:hypothetical protein